MKYGIAVPNFGKFAGKKQILELSVTAEELGYDSLWVSDHVVVPKDHKGFGNIFYDPIVTLSFIAAKTNKIKLGTSVIVLSYRNPIVFAKEISTLDVLSEGRIILGVGAGWLKEEFDALGINYNERGLQTNEALKIMKELYLKESYDFKGKYYKFSKIEFYPKPFNNRIPQIWVGGGSPSALKRSVEYGDGWHAVGSSPDEIKEKLAEINNLLLKYGKNREKFIISVRKNLQIIHKRIENKKENLRGSLEEIKIGLQDYKDAGVNHIVFQILGNSFKDILETMKVVKEKIL
ncbi:MAG: LLM class flavin-dependent oxidoreductase [Thermodesulfobacteriota bacterium]